MDKGSSTNPEDATFSYQEPNDPSIWGPYCFDCMNRWYNSGKLKPSTPLYLHLLCRAVPCSLDKLVEANGPNTPFTFTSLIQEIRKNVCMNERCRQKDEDKTHEETFFFSVTNPGRREKHVDEVEVAFENEEESQTEEAVAAFEDQSCTADGDDLEKSSAVVFKATGSEVEMIQAEQGDKHKSLPTTAIQSCSSVLEVSDLQGDEGPPGRRSFEQEDTCSLAPDGRTVSHMHLPSSGEEFLSPEQLTEISNQTYKALMRGRKCFRTKYRAIKAICVLTCYVCGFRSRCTCEYALHIFSPLHYGALIRDMTSISRESFNFWLEQMVELRQQSPHPFPNLQLDLVGPVTLKYRESRTLIPISDIGPELFPELPVSCRIRPEAATLIFMNADTTSKDLVLEENYLLQLTEAVRVHSYSTCYEPTSGCPFIRQFCPEVCELCGFTARCACRYIFHLFSQQHIWALNKNKIKVSLVDIHFWMQHLVSFAKLDINYRMRSILEPLAFLGSAVPLAEYPFYTKTPSSLPPVTPQSNPSCRIS